MSSNKRPRIALFLGAGASKPFGKPTTEGLRAKLIKEYEELRDEILKEYAGKSNNPQVKELWHSILLHSILSFKEFGDIEHVLQALKEIDDFFIKSQYGGRYVQSLIKGNYADKYSPDSVQDWRFTEYLKTIPEQRKRIENNIFDNYRWDNNSDDEALGQIYDPLFAEIMKHSNSNDIRIFTTNYDRAIEEYCSNEQRIYQCIDGFIYDYRSGRRKWNKGKYEAPLDKGEVPVYLYKLHGSLDWKMHKKHGIVATGEEGLSSDLNYSEQMLVYPTLSPKDGQEVDPYKTIREKFKEELTERTDVCIVIGFSFRDEHINLIFSDFIKRVGKTVIVVSPSAEENIYDNLLKRNRPVGQDAPWSGDDNVKMYEEGGTMMITINHPIDADNAEKIITQMIGRALSSQTGQRALPS